MARVEGFADCIAALRELKTTVARNVGRRALVPAGDILASAATANAPVLTGNLKRSISVDRKQRSASKRAGVAELSVIASDLGAAAIEYGTSDTAAQPYMRPAVDANEGRMTAAVAQAVQEGVMAATARASRKAAKG